MKRPKKNRQKRRPAFIRGQRQAKDTCTKIVFQKDARFAEVFNRTVFQSCPIQAESLSERDVTEAATVEMTRGKRLSLQYLRDASRRVMDDNKLLTILGVEGQDKVDYTMPLRILGDEFVWYARQASEIIAKHKAQWQASTAQTQSRETARKGAVDGMERESEAPTHKISPGEFLCGFLRSDRIAPSVTLVIYYGVEPWDGALSLREMYIDSPWAKYAMDNKVYLLDIRRMSDAEIAAYSDDLRVLFTTLKYASDKDILQERFQTDTAFQNVSEDIVDALATYLGDSVMTELKSSHSNDNDDAGGINKDAAFSKMFESVREEGREEVRKEAKKQIAEAQRQADEAHRKADEAHRQADEAQRQADEAHRQADETQQKAIINLIRMFREMRMDENTIIDKVRSVFQLPWEQAARYVSA